MSKEWGIISKEIKNHKDLEVWKKSMDLVSNIYKITESFPNKELYGLTNQIRRAAVSVPSNIAEGAARSSKKEFILANKLEYLNNLDTLLEDLKFVQKLINGLIYYLKK